VQGEAVRSLEREYLERNKSELQPIISGTASNMELFYNEIFDFYECKQTGLSVQTRTQTGQNDSLESIVNSNPMFTEVNGDRDILIWARHVFELSNLPRNGTVYVRHKGIKLYPRPVQTMDNMARQYRDKVIASVSDVVAGQRQNEIGLMEHKDTKNGTTIGINGCELYLRLNPFIIRKDGADYSFDEVTIFTQLAFRDNMVRIVGKPRVTSGYHHPFVYSDGSICYGNEARFDHEGISWEYMPIDSAANNAATVMNIARKVMQIGYCGSRVSPVNTLSRTNFTAEHISAMTRRGEIVFDNDTR